MKPCCTETRAATIAECKTIMSDGDWEEAREEGRIAGRKEVAQECIKIVKECDSSSGGYDHYHGLAEAIIYEIEKLLGETA